MIDWQGRLASIALVASLAAPLQAQAQDEEAVRSIVVTGNRDAPLEAEVAIRQTARAMARTVPHDTALPRFIDPLCLAVAGIEAGQAGKLHRLISGHFAAQDISNAAKGCSPNVLVVISPDPHHTVALLAKRQPALFRAETRRQRTSQLERGDPAIVWATHDRRSSLGGRLRRSAVLPGMAHTGFDGEISAVTAVNSNATPRRVDLTSSLAIHNAVIVLDANEAQGKTLGQLASYVTMRVLAFPQVPERTASDLPSILDLFKIDAATQPDGLTDFDHALLTGLYDMRINASPNRLVSFVLAAFRSGDSAKDGKAFDTKDAAEQ